MRTYSAAVIGLGNIGQGYDYLHNTLENILTHTTGFASHPGFEFIAGVDTDLDKRKQFEKKFNLPSYENLQALAQSYQPEVYAIGVPTLHHYLIFKETMMYNPVGILLEKPIASSLKEANEMVTLAEKNECSFLVNYSRRFEPAIIELKNKLENGEIGDIYKGTIWYTKGFINNASHFVDMLMFFFGEVTDIRILKKGRKWDAVDPEPDVCLSFGEKEIYFVSGRHECFAMNTMELVGTKGAIRYKSGGTKIDIFKTNVHPMYMEYQVLSDKSEKIPMKNNLNQWHPIDALYNNLTQRTPLNSDGKTARETLKILQKVLEQA